MKKLTITKLVVYTTSFFILSLNTTLAQEIKTPKTELELKEEKPKSKPKPLSKKISAPVDREIQKHSAGIGLGQNFLLGNYSDHGDSKIGLDFFYSYAASYSFDLVINTHYSKHTQGKEDLRVFSTNAGIKSRLFEFDNFSPYVLAGLGFYAPKATRILKGEKKTTEDKFVFGAHFGSGVDLRLNETYTVGVLGQLHWPFNSSQSNQPNLKGYYFKLLMTLNYLF